MSARPHPTARRVASALLLLAAELFGGSLAWFAARVAAPARLPTYADGIVVLTGGADRVAAGLRLLAQGRARILLVSGVGGDAGFGALARQTGTDPALAERVTLGRVAASTYGNAQETAAWARANRLDSLIVVTAYYHMPRALAELSRALPGVRLYPDPVRPVALVGVLPLRLLAVEYAKWLAAQAGLTAFGEAELAQPRMGG